MTLTVPERTWIGTVTRKFPDAQFHVRSVQSCDGVGVAFVEIVTPNSPAILQEMRGYDVVQTVEVFQQNDSRALVQIEADGPVLLRVLDKAGVPIETPFEINDGEVTWQLTTTRNRLSALATELEDSEIGYLVEHIWDSAQFDRTLTDRQQELVETALESGYYNSPRECTQEGLAAELDMAKSTCSETLHRAEERIIKRFKDGDQPTFTQTKQHA